jgi:hypothetical protein
MLSFSIVTAKVVSVPFVTMLTYPLTSAPLSHMHRSSDRVSFYTDEFSPTVGAGVFSLFYGLQCDASPSPPVQPEDHTLPQH